MQLVLLAATLILAFSYAAGELELIDYFRDPAPHIQLKPRKTTAHRIAEHGYPVETHNLVTEDGYILTMFRIPFSHNLQNQHLTRPIVLLLHGLLSCSDGWIHNGPNDALPFLLADAGFDVWLGNARGNTYSRNHTTRSLKHPWFWRFSWHEIGYYDLAAMVDYTLVANGERQKSIHYVGHSQGTTAFMAFISTRPEYNAKIKTAHMLAPVGYMSNMRDALVRSLAPYLGHDNKYSAFFGCQEFLPYNDLFIKLGYNACCNESQNEKLCSAFAFLLQGEAGKSNETAQAYFVETHPSGISTDQICHYMQEQQSGHFRPFDFGISKNLAIYGQATPPDYAVELITANMHMWYSDNDEMAAVEDVEKLAQRLPNKFMHHMTDPLWAHGDFLLAMEVREFVNDPIIKIMLRHETENFE